MFKYNEKRIYNICVMGLNTSSEKKKTKTKKPQSTYVKKKPENKWSVCVNLKKLAKEQQFKPK